MQESMMGWVIRLGLFLIPPSRQPQYPQTHPNLPVPAVSPLRGILLHLLT